MPSARFEPAMQDIKVLQTNAVTLVTAVSRRWGDVQCAVACLTVAFTQQLGSNVGATFRNTRVLCLVDVK
jgi:hypothetical protein